jgi:DNA-binding NtrC family response regulator
MKFTVLVVDDEKNIREGLREALALEGYEVATAADGEEALALLGREEVDLVVTDLRMPKLSGEELLKRIAADWPTVPVIILTGHGTIENAVQAMHAGAYDFLTKPVDLERLGLLVKRALSTRELSLQYRELREEVERKNQFATVIGRSALMRRVFDRVRQVAPARSSVLITGESGVGKEMVAEAIHYNSPRRDKALIKVHCAALAESLLESELFGHERGAFTGAVARTRGRFELAHLGTLFLDEIGEISPGVQVKLLRVLEERKFERVGGEETVEVDVRIVTATNRDLPKAIAAGTFREDLYYRLNVVSIEVPPLRERREDIDLLVAAFLKEFSEENGKRIEGIDARARAALIAFDWPGNVRQLRNSIESAVVLARGTVIGPDDLPQNVRGETGGASVSLPVGATLADAERDLIRATLAREGGNKSRAADILGIGRKTLHRKLQEYGLEPAD